MNKDKLWIMIDLESSGPIIGRHSSSWFEAQGKKFSVELPHVAVDDAKIQLEHFFARG